MEMNVIQKDGFYQNINIETFLEIEIEIKEKERRLNVK